MPLVLTEEQQMLKSSARELLQEKAPILQLRQLRDEKDPIGYDPTLWKEMAEMGWPALIIPEQYNGLDFGYTGLGQVLEEMGRMLTASPIISSVLLSGTAINLGGNAAQKETLLPAIAAGDTVIAFAVDEGKHHQPHQIKTTALKVGDSYLLNGTKHHVIDGHVADQFIVVAKTDHPSGFHLFLVDANLKGVNKERIIMMDSRNMATVHFNNLIIPADNLLNGEITGEELLEKTLDIGRIGLAAEMLGGIQEAFERTMAYLKERQQFGVPIGSFQALQHRAAIMFGEIELCKSIVIKALQAIDENSPDLSRLASLAKAKLGQTYKLVSNEGVQMFGGIGMTDDEEIGFFLKRARVIQQILGDTNFHLDRLAKMKGY